MQMLINYKTKDEEIHINCKGFFFFPLISFTNRPHDFIKSKIRCGKSLDKIKIKEYYEPKYINETKQKEGK